MNIEPKWMEPIPLREDETGTIRVGATRVTLDLVADAFRNGATAEQICDQYPSISLSDVYAVITWMLRRPDELIGYLARREQEAIATRNQIEQLCPQTGIRERLLARRRTA